MLYLYLAFLLADRLNNEAYFLVLAYLSEININLKKRKNEKEFVEKLFYF